MFIHVPILLISSLATTGRKINVCIESVDTFIGDWNFVTTYLCGPIYSFENDSVTCQDKNSVFVTVSKKIDAKNTIE